MTLQFYAISGLRFQQLTWKLIAPCFNRAFLGVSMSFSGRVGESRCNEERGGALGAGFGVGFRVRALARANKFLHYPFYTPAEPWVSISYSIFVFIQLHY